MISVKHVCAYCREDISLIENYEEAINSPEKWHCHHRLETHFEDGTMRPLDSFLSGPDLIKQNLYYGRPASELIFLSIKDHFSLHSKSLKYKQRMSESIKKVTSTKEYREKMSKALKGKNTWSKGKKHSEEHKQKTSKGLKDYYKNHENPMKGKHQTDEAKAKQSAAFKGRHWKLIDGKRVWI